MKQMKAATSRLSPQGQISVPAEVRTLLGLAPGSLLQWEIDGEEVRVRRGGRFTSGNIHAAAFGRKRQKPVTVAQMDEAIAQHLRAKHARR